MTPRRRRRSPGRTTLRVLGAATLALVLVVGLTGAYLYRDLSHGLHVSDDQDRLTDRPSALDVAGPDEPINILVMGSDSRDGANDIDGDASSGERSDTTMLLHLSADRTRAYGISIPRDSVVDRPACPASAHHPALPATNHVMWNDAFGAGGAACTMQQFEQLTRIRLDHNIVVDFDGFKRMVDAIGGVRMCIPEDMVDDGYTHTTIKAGANRLLDGDESRTYVRMRHITDPAGNRIGDGSDLSRARRQQAFVGALVNQAMSADVLTNPLRLRNLLAAIVDSITVDKGLGDVAKLAGLARQLSGIGLDDIQFLTIPNLYPPDDPNRVAWLEPQAGQVWDAIRHDRAIPKRLLTGVITAGAKAAGGTARPSPTRTPANALPATQYDDPARNGLCS